MGADWERLTAAYAATRTFRARVLGDTSGAGTTGLDDAYAAAYFQGVGAEIMGAGMFGLHAFGRPELDGLVGPATPVPGARVRADPRPSSGGEDG